MSHHGHGLVGFPSRRDLAIAAACLVLAPLLIAAVIAVAFQQEARDALGPVVAPEADPTAVWDIASNNVRLVVGLGLASWLLTSWWSGDSRAARAGACLLLALIVGFTVATAWVIGQGLGAYPAVVGAGIAAHAPLEIPAFVLALSLVVRCLQRPAPPARTIAVFTAVAAALLVPAAALEVYL